MSAASSANLIVAAADLNLVTLLVRAMRPANIAAAQASGAVSSPCQPVRHSRPDPVIEPRQVVHPAPLIAPRKILHPAPRVERSSPRPARQLPDCSQPKHTEPVFQPPWKILPWPRHTVEPHRFKPVAAQPDILVKGLLIDLFV